MPKFPFTNYHELNLDWILKKVNALFDASEENARTIRTYDTRLNSAEQTATSAATAATSAQQLADAAAANADNALSVAGTADAKADSALTASTDASSAVSGALTAAQEAQQTAGAAVATANDAAATAASLESLANTANQNATAAVETAGTANQNATAAQTAAQTADQKAVAAQQTANSAQAAASTNAGNISTLQTNVTDLNRQISDLNESIDNNNPDSRVYISAVQIGEVQNNRYFYQSTSTTPNRILPAGKTGFNCFKIAVADMPDYIAFDVRGITGIAGFFPCLFGNGSDGADYVLRADNVSVLREKTYVINLSENIVLFSKEYIYANVPSATHLFINYNAEYLGVRPAIYYNKKSVNERLTAVETDGYVTPNRTSFLLQTKNYYNPSTVINGYYMDQTGTIRQDARYSYIGVEVPSGKTAFVTASINGAPRALNNSVRFMCAKNASGAVVGSSSSSSTAYQYTNTTNGTVTVYFTLWYAHPTYTASDYMIQIVDSVDDVVVSDYIQFGYTFSNEIIISGATDEEVTALSKIVGLPESFFTEEIETTAKTIMEKTVKPCLTYNIITDTHLRPSSEASVRQTYDSIANIAALNRVSYADAVVHLGDTVSQSMYTQDGASNEEIFTTMREYVKRFSATNAKAFPINGNHDGIQANIYQQFEWYSLAGRLNTDYVTKEGGDNYFYVDYPDIKTRCVFITTPDNIEDASSAVFGYTPRLLSWLVSKALDTPNDYGVIMFAHIAPFFTWYIPNGMSNRSDFYGICNAFNNHTSYTGTVQSADFSGKIGTKIVAYICGHAHGDAVLEAGETVSGVDENGNAVQTTNSLPCPVIVIGCGLFSEYPMNNFGAVAPSRTDKTVTQDLWDTMVYRPDLHKIYMIRFGAGNDREIDVN